MKETVLSILLWFQSLVSPVPLNETDVYCLTKNAYYEAKGDSQLSQIAVTHVVLNRMHDPKFPKNACEVVYQKNKSDKKDSVMCQFSWYCDKRLMGRKVNADDWEDSYEAVKKALKMYYFRQVDVTQGSMYYHANYVNPQWNRLQKVTTIGSHIYYREK